MKSDDEPITTPYLGAHVEKRHPHVGTRHEIAQKWTGSRRIRYGLTVRGRIPDAAERRILAHGFESRKIRTDPVGNAGAGLLAKCRVGIVST